MPRDCDSRRGAPRRWSRLWPAVGLALALAACESTPEPEPEPLNPFVRYKDAGPPEITPLDTVERDDGLRYELVARGRETLPGEPPRPAPKLRSGDHVYLHFTGWLAKTGRKFDSSLDRGVYLEYIYGRHQVCPGFDAAIDGMRIGETRRLHVPWRLGFGPRGSGPVPPRQDLIYDVQLMDIGR